jgi:UDP-N-acetylmuramate: L-alanyl-gamma-D-glutamyl-meso-diaminopimelate ligase
VESYSASGAQARWQGQAWPLYRRQQQVLTVTRDGEPVLEVRLSLSGTHNANNALAVAATALNLGIEAERVAEALGRFSGVRRRQEVRGEAGEVTVIDDFAHHPTAIHETLAGLREVIGAGKLVAVFEPRSATSRRKVFEQRFAEALAVADHAVIAGLHDPAGIPEPERLDPGRVVQSLQASGTGAAHLESVEAIVEHLVGICEPGDTVVVMSSGSFGGLPDRLLAALGELDA